MEEGKRVVRQYEMSFTLGAVELVEKQGYSVVEAGIAANNLYHWRRQNREGRLLPDKQRAQPTPEEAELRRLHEENKRLKLEVEILKKATSYFVRQQT